LERIRAAHRNRGFGDIGYHYLVDPAGRVWAGRELSWQGAHVANQNPGNLGICVMGNYEIQQPNQAQLEAVERFVAAQMGQYHIRIADVKTHQERAQTACPGRSLQPRLSSMRSSSTLLARA
jgi:N-acetyl-anhydromuramyl-L-alanine amidase AmpD